MTVNFHNFHTVCRQLSHEVHAVSVWIHNFFLSLRFYVKSFLGNLEVQNLSFEHIVRLRILITKLAPEMAKMAHIHFPFNLAGLRSCTGWNHHQHLQHRLLPKLQSMVLLNIHVLNVVLN